MLTKQLTKDLKAELSVRYGATLRQYLSEGGEEPLRQAYELGRRALIAGLGALEMAELHHQALMFALEELAPLQIEPQMKRATLFFEESLAPFEITHQGYRDAVEVMRRATNFAFTTAHEIHVPLTSLLLSTGMLQEMLQAAPDSLEGRLLSNMLTAITILQARADDMLDVTGMYAGTLTLRIRAVQLTEFLQQIFAYLEPGVRWQGMQFTREIEAQLPAVEIDPDRIQQVVTDLVQNAVKFAIQGSEITLRAAVEDRSVVIQIKGRGRDAAAGQKESMGAGEVPGLADTQTPASGLGPLLCQQIIEAHRGSLNVFSEAGEGSTAEIRLPVAESGREAGYNH